MKKRKMLLVVKVGNDDRPAGPKDIKDITKKLKKLGIKIPVLVTHHVISFELLPVKQ